jgi:hypothetical protein
MSEAWTPMAIAEAAIATFAGCILVYVVAAMIFGLGQKDD